MSENSSYSVSSTTIIRTPTYVERLVKRAALLPGLTDVSGDVCDRLAIADSVESALGDLGMRVDRTDDVRGSALWAEADDGLVLAAVLSDNGRLEFDVARSRGAACTLAVERIADHLRLDGFDVNLGSRDVHDDPAGSLLARKVRSHLVANGSTPSSALLDDLVRPVWTESSTSSSTGPARQVTT